MNIDKICVWYSNGPVVQYHNPEEQMIRQRAYVTFYDIIPFSRHLNRYFVLQIMKKKLKTFKIHKMKHQYCLNPSLVTNYMHFDKPWCLLLHLIVSYNHYNCKKRFDDDIESLLGKEDQRWVGGGETMYQMYCMKK